MNRIKELRTRNGMTQAELAEIIGINSVTLARYESGDRNPKIDKLEKMAEVFNVSVDYLTGKSDINLTQDDIDMFDKINSLDGMELKKYIAELNSKGVSSGLDPTNKTRYKYARRNLGYAVTTLNKFLMADYDKYNQLSLFTSEFLARSLKLMENDDENDIILKNIFEALLTKRGILSDDIFKYVKTEIVDGKKKKNLVDAPMDIALDNYFKNREKLNAALDNYFLGEFNKRYKD